MKNKQQVADTRPFDIRAYAGVVNINKDKGTHHYTYGSLFFDTWTIVPRAYGLAMVDDFPEWLGLIDQTVVEEKIKSRCEAVDDGALAFEYERNFLYRIFPVIDADDLEELAEEEAENEIVLTAPKQKGRRQKAQE